MTDKERISQLKRKRLIGAIIGLLGLIAAYFGFSTSYDAHKELIEIGEKNFGEFKIGEEKPRPVEGK